MKAFIATLALIIMAASANNAFAQKDTSQSTSANILSNWAAAQLGEFTGWGLTALTIYSLEAAGVVNSDNNSDNTYLISGIAAGHLAANYLLKRKARQSNGVFIKNLAFSALPVLTYAAVVKPDYDDGIISLREIKTTTGLILVSMLVTPVFSALGNELFNRETSHFKHISAGIQKYPLPEKKNYIILSVKYHF
ncbi:MAG: hypothetical protein WAN36_12440 [Calditrichia bacterium]